MGIFNTLGFILSHPLNYKRKLASIIRLAQWQLGSAGRFTTNLGILI